MILTTEDRFEVVNEKKIGHMRCDFVDGSIANSWFGTELAKEENIDLHEIQKTVNQIMFEEITSFQKVVELCGGEGYDKRSNRFVYEGSYNYWIDLIPVKDDYNYYIHVYQK